MIFFPSSYPLMVLVSGPSMGKKLKLFPEYYRLLFFLLIIGQTVRLSHYNKRVIYRSRYANPEEFIINIVAVYYTE